MPYYEQPRNSIAIGLPRKSVQFENTTRYHEEDENVDNYGEEEVHNIRQGRPIDCWWLPCCMDEEEAEEFGHNVSVFMVALVAFATFFCVTLILVLVFLLG